MILSFKMKGDVIPDHFLMLRFQKDPLDTVGFRTYGGGARVLNQKVTFRVLNLPSGGGRYVLNVTNFLTASLEKMRPIFVPLFWHSLIESLFQTIHPTSSRLRLALP